MLIEMHDVQPVWTSPELVLSFTPSFCRFTGTFPGKTTAALLTQSFGQLLGVESWSAERHLYSELRGFLRKFQADKVHVEEWKATCKYLFSAIKSIPQQSYKNLRSCEGWIREILDLSMFPVTCRSKERKLRGLRDGCIFVPNSPALNSVLGDKVDLLDFVGQDMYKLVPFLEFVQRVVTPHLKFLSTYDTDKDIKIPKDAMVCDEAEALLRIRKKDIARYFHTRFEEG